MPIEKKTCVRAILVLALGFLVLPTRAAWAQATYEIEPNHSTVEFSVPIAGGITRVTGKFRIFNVTIFYDGNDATKSSVKAVIKVSSIDTGVEQRDKGLQGETFFDSGKYPEIIFQSKKIAKRGEKYVVIGDLTMRGVTREIELPFDFRSVNFDPKEDKPILAASVRWKLNRNDFGVGTKFQHTAIPNFIGDEIGIEIDMWTHPAEPPQKAQ